MTQAKSVLDHGYVRFIEDWGAGDAGVAEAGIIEAARQSTQGSFRGWDQDERLLKFLYMSNPKHATPFEFAGMVIEVQAPIFVFREWHRHRTQCLAASTPIVFNMPNGKPLRVDISDLAKRWNVGPATRQRSATGRREFNRQVIGAMKARSPGGDVSVTDAWHSGVKKLYRLRTKYGEITGSADHLIKTPDGGNRIGDSPKVVMAMIQDGEPVPRQVPVMTESEIAAEEWREFADGYEVSDLGRVRSWLTTRRGRRAEPIIKAAVSNRQGRLVVSIPSGVAQVSRLVWAAFVGPPDGQVLHLDDNSWDNRLTNLYLGIPADNAADRIRNGSQTRLRERPVEVLSITAVGEGDTFDLSVTGEHWFVADNIVVHNSYNEMSARYAPLPDLNYTPAADRCLFGGGANKQAGAVAGSAPVSRESASAWLARLTAFYREAEDLYQDGLALGLPKEVARVVIPVGRYSRMRACTNLRNWLAFLTLRSDPGAQWEIRQYASAVGEIVAARFPRVWELFRLELKEDNQCRRILSTTSNGSA